MKKGISAVFLLLLCLALTACGVSQGDTSVVQAELSDAAEILTETVAEISTETAAENSAYEDALEPQNAPLTDNDEIVNVVIFICFADESPTQVRTTISDTIIDSFNGEENSLQDYYLSMSYGKFNLCSIFPYADEENFYIYQDSHNRSYYTNNSNKSGTGRTRPESALLNNAVLGANGYFSYQGLDLDADKDGYVDSVTFLVSGAYNDPTDWGRIMWPHSWQLDDISQSFSTSGAEKLNGVTVNDYTFLFLQSFYKVGLMCHEFGHAIGDLPDLYHYKYDTSYLSVGYWDLMHLDCKTPQYMTTYMRWKYLHFVDDSQIVELQRSGTYTLTPTVTTDEDGVLAYVVTISQNESIWIEYRRNDVSTYDSDLPGSGIIVYRVNTNAEKGNQQARQNNYLHPEELYVFRPNCAAGISGTTEKEKYNLSYAYVSNNNPVFSSIGDADCTDKFDSNCIYLSNGKNTGITLSVVYEDQEEVSFFVNLGNYDIGDIASAYVEGTNEKGVKTINSETIRYGEEVKVDLYIKYKARSEAIRVNSFLLEYDYCVCTNQTAYAVYTDEYGTYRYPFSLTILDKMTGATVYALPDVTEYEVGDTLSLEGLVITASFLSGDEKQIAYTKRNASLWTAEGYTTEESGRYTVQVTYEKSVTVSFVIVVQSEIVSITVSEKDTWHINCPTKEACFTVEATYRDGTKGRLTPESYTVSFDAETLYAKKEVTVTFREQPSVTCTSYVYNVPETVGCLTVLKYPKGDYAYGEKLDLTDGVVQVVCGNFSFSVDVPMENFYSLLAASFDSTETGNHLLRIPFGDAVLSLSLNVAPLADEILSSLSAHVTVGEDRIFLTESITLSDLATVLASPLSIAFFVGEDRIAVKTHGSKWVASDVIVKIENESGQEVCAYSVVLVGDGNADGLVDERDVAFWEKAVLTETYEIAFDLNRDGTFTLTEFLKLLRGGAEK